MIICSRFLPVRPGEGKIAALKRGLIKLLSALYNLLGKVKLKKKGVILEVWSFQFIFDVSCHVTAVWDFISIDRRESKAIRVITSVSLSVTSFPQSGVSVSERPGMVQKRNLSRSICLSSMSGQCEHCSIEPLASPRPGLAPPLLSHSVVTFIPPEHAVQSLFIAL